jgi:hypothetical protein
MTDAPEDRYVGIPYQFTWCRDTGRLFLNGADGRPACVTDLLLGKAGAKNGLSMMPGPQGPPGPKGDKGDTEVVVIGPNDAKAAIERLRKRIAAYEVAIVVAKERAEKLKNNGLKSGVKAAIAVIEAHANG